MIIPSQGYFKKYYLIGKSELGIYEWGLNTYFKNNFWLVCVDLEDLTKGRFGKALSFFVVNELPISAIRDKRGSVLIRASTISSISVFALFRCDQRMDFLFN